MRVFEKNPYSEIKTREIEDGFNDAHSETFGKIRVTYADQDLRYIVLVFERKPSSLTLAATGRIICRAFANVRFVTDKDRTAFLSRSELLR